MTGILALAKKLILFIFKNVGITMENEDETTAQTLQPENDPKATENPQKQEGKEGTEEVLKLKQQVEEAKDKYLRLYADYENFRRRTAKEKIDFFKTANQDLIKVLLPVLDDFERARKAFEQEGLDTKTLKEGVELIFQKLFKNLEAKGLKTMQSIGETFDSDLHEAITQIPSPSPELKGKIVDELEKGYYLEDKVIRFAKVIIGN